MTWSGLFPEEPDALNGFMIRNASSSRPWFPARRELELALFSHDLAGGALIHHAKPLILGPPRHDFGENGRARA